MSDKNTQENLITVESIADKIYFVRGQRVMLDSDLAEVYSVTTKRLNEQVKRNIERFPEDFMFQLTEQEFESLRSQFATSNKQRGGRRYFPYVFTEHGAVMLASVLKSQIAVDASIQVVRAFIQMRTILLLHSDLAERIEELEQTVDKHDEKFKVVSHLLTQILGDKKRVKRPIGFIDKKKS
ncbi:MAG TPA: ORF6N domain-containing protein [Pyrinomonadaceae bacterium]|jgi:phage regulator Rha-like protein